MKGRRRRKQKQEREEENREMGEFLNEIANMEKAEGVEEDNLMRDLDQKKEESPANKRDIYIQQRDQYFVDDEEVYLNELISEECDWTFIKSGSFVFRVYEPCLLI